MQSKNLNEELPLLVIKLIKALNENEVSYCHWKSNEHLIPGIYGKTDLDILIRRQDSKKFIKILNGLGFVQLRSNIYQPVNSIDDWLGYCSSSQITIHIHAHYKIVTGKKFVKEYYLPWEEIVLNNVITDSSTGMEIIDPNLELIILLIRLSIKLSFKNRLKSLFTSKSIISKDIQNEIDYLLSHCDEKKVKEYIEILFNNEKTLSSHLKEIIMHSKHNRVSITRLKKLINKHLNKYRTYSSILTNYKYEKHKMKYYYNSIKSVLKIDINRKKSPITGGLIIAFIGADGSGKSTMLNETYNWLNWKINVVKLYLGSGDYNEDFGLKLIKRFIKKNKNKNSTNKVNDQYLSKDSNTDFKSKLRTILKAMVFVYIAKNKMKTLQKASKMSMKGTIVLLDRYPQTQFFGINDGRNIRYNNEPGMYGSIIHRLSKVEEKLFSRMQEIHPDIVFKLNVDPSIAIQRKPDHDFNHIKTKVDIVSKLSFKNSIVYEINANSSIYEVQNLIKNSIWSNL